MSSSAFHKGEREAQAHLGLGESVASLARRLIRSGLTDMHRRFVEKLPFVVAAARDKAGRPWATMISGAPGFVTSVDRSRLELQGLPPDGDALCSAFAPGADVGLLAIDLDTRRRVRINGRIVDIDEHGFALEASQAFGNCPQYITQRSLRSADRRVLSPTSKRFTELDDTLSAWIGNADTFFIASGYDGDAEGSKRNGMDASHRGGNAGFVEVLGPTTLLFPDFTGNNFFNTIGNLLVDPRVGMLFVDFEHGHLLQVTGTARIDWGSGEVARRPGAQRLIYVTIDAIVCTYVSLSVRFS